jgi:hypothetical protein
MEWKVKLVQREWKRERGGERERVDRERKRIITRYSGNPSFNKRSPKNSSQYLAIFNWFFLLQWFSKERDTGRYREIKREREWGWEKRVRERESERKRERVSEREKERERIITG